MQNERSWISTGSGEPAPLTFAVAEPAAVRKEVGVRPGAPAQHKAGSSPFDSRAPVRKAPAGTGRKSPGQGGAMGRGIKSPANGAGKVRGGGGVRRAGAAHMSHPSHAHHTCNMLYAASRPIGPCRSVCQ